MCKDSVGPVRAGAAAALLIGIVGTWALVAYTGISVSRIFELNHSHPLTSLLIFIALHCLAAAALLPCSPITLAAGFMWGPWRGLAISMVAALCASCFTFLIARYLAKPAWREKVAESAPGKLLVNLGTLGWKGVAMAQLNPVVPASTLGYLFGLSPLSFRTYVWSVLLFMLPLQVTVVAFGASLRGALVGGAPIYIPLLVSLTAAAIYAGARYFARTHQPGNR